MNNLNDVLEFVKQWNLHAPQDEVKKGLDAKTVACQMGIWQNDAAAALNRLCEENKLSKSGSRPIRYHLIKAEGTERLPNTPEKKKEHDAFARVIGADGSLHSQIQLAEAGASYPPNGMHMLITGEPGVGKSLFAEEVWRFMNQNRQPGSPQKPFVVFNCAEYADNPQLLLSQLFGHEKGAYTGADTSSSGLVEEADGGILFLDEIHRLPATGQEMLFTLLDRGLFRRLGSSQDRLAHLMLIGATTEDPAASFLRTFRRRIPMLIEIPNLSERPIKERIQLVMHFLTEEVGRLNAPIRISLKALGLLLSYRSDANIGDLKNEIQLACARGYLTYLSLNLAEEKPPYIEFTVNNLSRRLQEIEVDGAAESYLMTWVKTNSLLISPGTGAEQDTEKRIQGTDFYGLVENRIVEYIQQNISVEDSVHLNSMDVKGENDAMTRENSVVTVSNATELDIFDSVTNDIMSLAIELVQQASAEFGCVYPSVVCSTLAMS